jgi:hypothetical protein
VVTKGWCNQEIEGDFNLRRDPDLDLIKEVEQVSDDGAAPSVEAGMPNLDDRVRLLHGRFGFIQPIGAVLLQNRCIISEQTSESKPMIDYRKGGLAAASPSRLLQPARVAALG